MAVACAGGCRSHSFPLAPSASRSRLKLCRGTDAFRGNGTQAEWTKRQAFGHFFSLPRPLRCVCWSRVEGIEGFSRCERFSALRTACAPSPVPLLSVSHRALSRKQMKLRRGVGSPSGPRHAGEAESVTESRSVQFVFQSVTVSGRRTSPTVSAAAERHGGAVGGDLAHDVGDLVAVEAHRHDGVGALLSRRLAQSLDRLVAAVE